MRWNFAKRRSVSHRIILSFMLAAALPLFMLGASAYYLAYSRLEQVALDDARGLAKSLGMDVFERLQLLTDQLLLVAENGATGRALHTRFEDLDLGERDAVVVEDRDHLPRSHTFGLVLAILRQTQADRVESGRRCSLDPFPEGLGGADRQVGQDPVPPAHGLHHRDRGDVVEVGRRGRDGDWDSPPRQ